MKKIIIVCLLCFLYISSYAQSIYENAEKYWYYRERLKNFVLVSSNYNEPGTNIPAERIYNNSIAWDDGNAAFNHYISVLATEYKLLKMYGQDYTQTIKELYYALKSFERLDATAESYYRQDNSQLSTDLNGFFIREDITDEFWSKYGKNGTNPYFKQVKLKRQLNTNHVDSIWSWEYEKSEDNTWHYLEAFSLVGALVDKEFVDGVLINFKQIAKDNVYRIIDDMKHNHMIHTIIWELAPPSNIKNNFAYEWYVENPVTGEPVELGSGLDWTMLYVSSGFAKTGNNLLGINEFSSSDLSAIIFKNMLAMPFTNIDLTIDVYNKAVFNPLTGFGQGFIDCEVSLTGPGYKKKIHDFVPEPNLPCKILDSEEIILADLSDDDYELRSLCATGNIEDINGLNPYEVLIKKQKESSVLKYEHFPLIWSVVNNNYSHISTEDKDYVLGLLNAAPACGPYYFSAGDDGGLWSSGSRLVWPEKLHGGCPAGEYNGLDYMLLHNLFWLATVSQYPANINYNPSVYKASSIVATNQITCSVPVDISSSSLNFISGKSIRLLSGFKVKSSANHSFKAEIGGGFGAVYKKLPLTGYNSCSDYIDTDELIKKKSNYKNEEKNSGGSLDNSEVIEIFNNDINLFPNPVIDKLNIVSQHNILLIKIEVYNLANNLVMIQNSPETNIILDVSNLISGMYFVKVTDENNQVYTKKIIKR